MTKRPRAVLRVKAQFTARRPWVPTAASLRRWAVAAHRAVAASARRKRRDPQPAAGDLCIRVVGAAASRRLNRDYRGRDRPTNVLSFPASRTERELAGLLGDLVICAPVVAAEARVQGKVPQAHWAHMVVHGVLHLHGHDHHRAHDARRMEGLEVEILRGFGYQNPYQHVTLRKQ